MVWGMCVCVCMRVCAYVYVCTGLGPYLKAWESALSWGGQNRDLSVGR